MPGCEVSIHAPARGATGLATKFSHSYIRFNPRTRTGCDVSFIVIVTIQISFNPRTRTGCDEWWVAPLYFGGVFQSTHPHGVRLKRWHLPSFIKSFQSTHPHGVRRFDPISTQKVGSFNPRTRTGCDSLRNPLYLFAECFNPRTRTGCD